MKALINVWDHGVTKKPTRGITNIMGKQGFASIEEKIAKLKASNICFSKNHISLENKSVKKRKH